MLKIVILFAAALVSVQGHMKTDCVGVTNGLDWADPSLHGKWHEVHRMPRGRYHCIEFVARLSADKKTLNIKTRRASLRFRPQDIRESADVPLVADQQTGYKVEFTKGKPVHINLIKLIDNLYIVGCGYTNPSDMSTSYGFILARPNEYDIDGVGEAILESLPYYSNFEKPLYLDYINIDQVTCRNRRVNSSHSRPILSSAIGLTSLMINVL